MAMFIDPPFYQTASAAVIREFLAELEDIERERNLDADDLDMIEEVRGEAEYFLRAKEEQDLEDTGVRLDVAHPNPLPILVDRAFAPRTGQVR